MAKKKVIHNITDSAIKMCKGSAALMQQAGMKFPKGKFYYETDEGFVVIDNSTGKIRRKTVATLEECVAFFN